MFPSGVEGDVDGAEVRSLYIVCPPGLRFIFKTSASDERWQEMPWRVVDVHAGRGTPQPGGRLEVNIPDLDLYTEADALRVDPDLPATYAHVERIEDGVGWTFGYRGALKLKGNLRAIRIERLPKAAK